MSNLTKMADLTSMADLTDRRDLTENTGTFVDLATDGGNLTKLSIQTTPTGSQVLCRHEWAVVQVRNKV